MFSAVFVRVFRPSWSQAMGCYLERAYYQFEAILSTQEDTAPEAAGTDLIKWQPSPSSSYQKKVGQASQVECRGKAPGSQNTSPCKELGWWP